MDSLLHQHQAGETIDLKTAREYLAAIERIARVGRSSEDPREILAALKTLAEPSGFLKRLAGLSEGRA